MHLVLVLSLLVAALASQDLDVAVQQDGAGQPLAGSLAGIPSTGFIKGLHASEWIGMQVLHKVNLPPTCATLEIRDLPDPNSSPLMGSSIFTLIPDRLYNEHFAWTNGKEYLYYIKHSRGDKGNWLIGVEPGVDSGYVYIEGPQVSSTPLQLESPSNSWKWLLEGSWVNQPQMQARCLDHRLVDHFFEVEYFDAAFAARRSRFYLTSESSGLLLDASPRWSRVDQVEPLLALGQPVILESDASLPLVAAVNVEHAPEPGWRVTLRALSEAAHREWSLVCTAAGEWRDPLSPPQPPPQLAGLTAAQQRVHGHAVAHRFELAQPGDFLWLWYEAAAPAEPAASRVELLVECLSRAGSVRVFRAYPTNRLEAMAQSVLSQNADLLVARLLSPDGVRVELRGQRLAVSAVVALGPQPARFVWDFVHYKERSLTAVSACFLYHAAVSMPHALVYAAELVCLLAGGKPLALVQVASPSDHQWKFPLVQQLTRGILAAKAAFGPAFPIDYQVFSYEAEETLVFYRTSRRYLADLLRPARQAQALHLLPYADATGPDLEATWREQVYNAAWNGLVLGYPAHFVTSYCEDFPNGLPAEEKLEVSQQAQREWREHMRETGQEPVHIQLGTDPPIDAEMLDVVFQTL